MTIPVQALAMAEGVFGFFEGIGTLQAIVLVMGLILLVVEVFTPGFGVAGGTGLALLVLGIILTARSLFDAMVMVAILLVILAIVLAVIIRSAKKGRLSRTLVLQSQATAEAGFKSTEDRQELVGKEGVALTNLRPAGTVDFAGERLDVVSEAAFIEKGQDVEVVRVEGRRIVVRPVHE
jgi:membrane-bound ClpP family serine protease